MAGPAPSLLRPVPRGRPLRAAGAALSSRPRSGERRNAWDRLRPLRRLTSGLETALVARFGRSPLSVLFRTPVLVLVTTGRRTGRRRETTLAYHGFDDGALFVVGGAGGQVRVPDWVANLRADPRATAVVDRVRHEVVADELTGEERIEMWSRLREVWRQIDTYERRAGRPVPVFRLTRS